MSLSCSRFARLCLVVLLGILGTSQLIPAQAATLTVTNKNDSGPGSLRQAIANASSGDTITFSSTAFGTIVLTSGELTLDHKTLTISGPGADKLTISGNSSSRVFNISSGVVTITGLTIANGRNTALGGGIQNTGGNVRLDSCILYHNQVASGQGGGVSNTSSGILTLINTRVYSNTAFYSGGGVYNNLGTVTIMGGSIDGNASGEGGGLANVSGAATVRSAAFYSNTASYGGGGLWNGSGGTLAVENSAIHDNSAVEGGGVASYHPGSTLGLTSTLVYSNTPTSLGSRGGGIVNSNESTAFIAKCAVYNNHGDAGVYNSGGRLTVVNTTISSHKGVSPDKSSGLSSEMFGGIPATSALNNVTIAENDTGIDATTGVTVTLSNSIVASNTFNCTRPVSSKGYNLESTNTCGLSATGDLTNTNPLLDSLLDNGGGTLTHALLDGSPAIDKANPTQPETTADACATVDQRGYPRPADGNNDDNPICDMGAYEYNSHLHMVYLPLIRR